MLDPGPFRRILSYLRPHRRAYLVGLACVPVTTALDLFLVRFIGRTLDGVTLAGDGAVDPGFLPRAAAVVVAVALVQAFLRFVTRMKVIGASRRIERALKDDLLAHLNRLPFSWFDRSRTGDILSRANQDVELLRFVVGPAPMYAASTMVLLPGALVVMLLMSPLVTAVMAATFALVVLLIRSRFGRLEHKSRAVQEAIGRLSDKAYEDFSGVRVLRAFARESAEASAFARVCGEVASANVDLARTRAGLHSLIAGMREAGILAVLVLGYLEASAGRMTPGDFFSFILYLGLLSWPLIAAGWILAAIPRARAAAVRVEEIFGQRPEEDRGGEGGAPAPGRFQGRIEARGLGFRHGREGPPALEDVSFHVEPGRTLGIVGPVGSGKTTLLALLTRFYDPPRGTLFLDGIDVMDLPLATLRSAFAVAPQDVFLFSDTIRGNVAFSRAGTPDPEHLARAVEWAALDDDLPALGAGLDQVVGERGLTLSGGQKQRVSLARALLADRPVLVLDDTLSAVDHGTERRILRALRAARRGRTTLLVAHRLSVVREADDILVLLAGRVAERGTHSRLLAEGGWYARTWARQQAARELEGL